MRLPLAQRPSTSPLPVQRRAPARGDHASLTRAAASSATHPAVLKIKVAAIESREARVARRPHRANRNRQVGTPWPGDDPAPLQPLTPDGRCLSGLAASRSRVSNLDPMSRARQLGCWLRLTRHASERKRQT